MKEPAFAYARFPLWIVIYLWFVEHKKLKEEATTFITEPNKVTRPDQDYVNAIIDSIEILRKNVSDRRILQQYAMRFLTGERDASFLA